MKFLAFLKGDFFSFVWKAALFGAICIVLGKNFGEHQFWIVVLSLPALAAPLFFGAIYSSVVKQTRGLHIFRERGRLYGLMSGRVFRTVIWYVWALAFGFLTLLQFHSYTVFEWVCFFSVIPVFYATLTVLRRWFGREIKEYLQLGLFLRWASLITPVIMVLAVILVSPYFSPPTEYPSWEGAIQARKATVADMTGSELVRQAALWTALYDGSKAYVLGRAGSEGRLTAWAITAVGSWFLFFNACVMFACFLIPRVEYRRVFGPLSDQSPPPPVSNRRIAVISALTSFVALFICVPLFANIENLAKVYKPQSEGLRARVEEIGKDLFRPGTIAKIEEAQRKLLAATQQSVKESAQLSDLAFAEMDRNVDAFLDWYYSLPAEYMRIGRMLTGDLEEYLEHKLSEYLRRGPAFQAMEEGLKRALAQRGAAWAEYEATVKRIMDENRVNVERDKVLVVKRMTMEDALNATAHTDWVNFRTRLSGAGIGGAVGFSVGAVVVKKVVGKVGLKKAAQVLVKITAGKALGALGGAGGGAALGGLIGSIVPVVGTSAGAVVGGIVGGIATGVAVDKLLLMLEEQFSRKEFKRELTASIEAARREFKDALR